MRGRVWLMLLVGLGMGASGCGRAEPEFTPRAEIKGLIPDAQKYVHEVMDQNFGTPTHMVLWERFPVHYHAAQGTVDGPPGPDEPLKISLEQRTLPITVGMEVTFLSGKVLDAVREKDRARKPLPPFTVAAYDESTHALTLSADLPAAPAAGDHFVVGPGEVVRQGRLLYAEHCLHCHGVAGDGNGPTAKYLNPHPRDYRLGIFKFTSTINARRAQRDDLARIIGNGIPGTYMPSFRLLTPTESTAIIEYVLWLSMRGETEFKRWQALKDDFSQTALKESREKDSTDAKFMNRYKSAWENDFPSDFETETNFIAGQWRSAQEADAVVTPKLNRTPTSAESIARGHELFNSATAKCASCHGAAGLGNGPQTLLPQKDKEGQDRKEPGLFDDWGNPIQPRNLRTGIYRGGRRPIDIYCRISAGIKGTPMPPFATALTDEQIWDLVNYVMSIPFEDRHLGEGPYVPAPAPIEGVAATNAPATND